MYHSEKWNYSDEAMSGVSAMKETVVMVEQTLDKRTYREGRPWWHGGAGAGQVMAAALAMTVGVAVALNAQGVDETEDLHIAEGGTQRAEVGAEPYMLDRVRMEDGATLKLVREGEGATVLIGAISVGGTATIRMEAHNGREEPFHLWLLDGGRGIVGTLRIDGSGRHGGNSGQRGGNGGSGEAGLPMVVNLVFSEGGYGVAQLIAEGRPLVPGRLELVSIGGNGGSPGPAYDPRTWWERYVRDFGKGYRLRSGIKGSGGNGGDVRVRVLWTGEPGLDDGYREREVAAERWPAVGERLGVGVSVAAGSGAGEPGEGQITLEIACWTGRSEEAKGEDGGTVRRCE